MTMYVVANVDKALPPSLLSVWAHLLTHTSFVQNYDFTITGVGNLKHFRKVDNPPEALYATQCAVLRRRDNGEVELRQSRSPMTTPLPFFSTLPDGDALPPTSPTRRPHILRSTQQHLVHPGAGHAASNKSIRKALAETMTFMNTTRDSLRSLW